MPNQMTNDQIQSAALAAGFTLKPQPDGGMALHPHVFEFARAMFAAGQQAAQDQIADLSQQLEQTSVRFQRARMTDIQARERAEFSASQWQQLAELAERQRDELAELLGDQGRADLKQTTAACPECGGSGQDIVHGMRVRCGGTGKEPA